MTYGKVKWYNPSKGFGFIEITSGDKSGKDIFVHASDIEGRPLRDDDEVEFDIDEDDRARKPRAARVTGGTGSDEDAKGGGKGFGKGGGKGDSGKGGKPGDWTCDSCSINNFASRTRCFKCDAPKPRDGGGDRGRGRRNDSRGGGRDDRRDDRRGGRDDRGRRSSRSRDRR